MMREVVIIDDEESIREGLPLLINWKNYGYDVVGTASNGKTGYELIQQKQPDVVVTDIRMPSQDGLEMVQQAYNQGLSFHTIFLSGYSDFSYAQKAVSLGASSYLLKPIDEDELIEILENLNEKDTQSLLHEHNLQWIDKLFGADDTGINEFTYIKALRFGEELELNDLKETFEEMGFTSTILFHEHYQYILLLSNHWMDQKKIERKCIKFFPNTEIISSRCMEGRHTIKPLMIDIQTLSRLLFLFPNQLISQKSIEKDNQKQSSTIEPIQEIGTSIMENKNIQSSFERYFASFYHDLALESEIKWQVDYDIHQLIYHIQEKMAVNFPFDFTQFHQEVYLTQNIFVLKDLVWEKIIKISEFLAQELNNNNIIEEVIRYTKKNYKEELTLKNIAEHFNYNSSYLGKKFRKETGYSYLNFLDKIRMQKATEILVNSNLMVYEVADKVGYSNVDYFYKKFKHYYKLSPNEYRNKTS